jgi:hypothetical protein
MGEIDRKNGASDSWKYVFFESVTSCYSGNAITYNLEQYSPQIGKHPSAV